MEEDIIKIAGITEESSVDGPGIRYVIFTQGCPHNCKGCHNPQTHDLCGGKPIKIDDLVEKINKNPMLSGVTLSGGEPFLQARALSKLIDKLDTNKHDVMVYTGFEYENLVDKSNEKNAFSELLSRADILIDGKFENDKKDELLMFRGSSNQRIIDCKNSLKTGKVLEAKVNEEGYVTYVDQL
ncbi:MAG: anaerobic ribonucleoside-triphosphate reductase activating protein [Clostridia bacterium]